jgi:hypothetical protein
MLLTLSRPGSPVQGFHFWHRSLHLLRISVVCFGYYWRILGTYAFQNDGAASYVVRTNINQDGGQRTTQGNPSGMPYH